MNPYRVLGVRENAPDEEIARAYKRLAKKYHPDLNPNNADASGKMGEINRAYEDIRALRRSGTAFRQSAPADPDAQARREYTYYYRRPKMDPVAMILLAVVVFLLVRFVLNLLFGGYYYMYGSYGQPGIGPAGYAYNVTTP